VDLDYTAITPGIWIPTRGSAELLTTGGDTMTKWEFEAIPDSINVNKPFDEASLSVEFPNGTRVSDQIANRSYFVGGDTRDPRSIEALAAQAEEAASPGAGAVVPAAGALSAAPTFWQRWSTAAIPIALIFVALGLLVYRWRRAG
jgi:hypothetical protein